MSQGHVTLEFWLSGGDSEWEVLRKERSVSSGVVKKRLRKRKKKTTQRHCKDCWSLTLPFCFLPPPCHCFTEVFDSSNWKKTFHFLSSHHVVPPRLPLLCLFTTVLNFLSRLSCAVCSPTGLRSYKPGPWLDWPFSAPLSSWQQCPVQSKCSIKLCWLNHQVGHYGEKQWGRDLLVRTEGYN